MGDIYRARDSMLGRDVAVKILGDRYAQDGSVRQRFTREALAAARLSGQPNTVTIFDVGEHEGRPYIVMEYLAGGSLDDVLREEGAQLPQRRLHVARGGGARAGRCTRARRRPPRRETGQSPARPRRECPRRRLRDRKRGRHGLADDDRHGARHRGVSLHLSRRRVSVRRPQATATRSRLSPSSCSRDRGRSSPTMQRRRPLRRPWTVDLGAQDVPLLLPDCRRTAASFNTSSSRVRVIGFCNTARAPEDSGVNSVRSLRPERKRTQPSGSSLRMLRQAVRPFSRAIAKSISTTSGLCRR